MPIIGQIILIANGAAFDGFDAPGFLPCDGRELESVNFLSLYSLVQTRFGGNPTGIPKFNVPNLPLPNGLAAPAQYLICVEGSYPPALDEVAVGRVEQFAFALTADNTSQGYMPCDGRSLQVRGFDALASLTGNAYGSSGTGAFSLPNVPSAASPAIGLPQAGYCIATEGASQPVGRDDFIGQIILLPTPAGPWVLPPSLQETGPIVDEENNIVTAPYILPCNGQTYPADVAAQRVLASLLLSTSALTLTVPKLTPPPGLEHHSYFIISNGAQFPAPGRDNFDDNGDGS